MCVWHFGSANIYLFVARVRHCDLSLISSTLTKVPIRISDNSVVKQAYSSAWSLILCFGNSEELASLTTVYPNHFTQTEPTILIPYMRSSVIWLLFHFSYYSFLACVKWAKGNQIFAYNFFYVVACSL